MVFRNSDLVFLVYETRGVMFSETTPPCFCQNWIIALLYLKYTNSLLSEKKTMLYQLQTCPIFVTILNEVKPNESNLRVRSLVFVFFWRRVKKNELNPSCKCTSLFSDRKTWRWYPAPSSGNVRSKDEHRDRHVVF